MVKIVTHHDADGVSSAILLLKSLGLKYNEVEIIFPEEFGDVTSNPDFCLDMRPDKGSEHFIGSVIDHHPGHPKEHDYQLYWEDVPTSVVVFNNFNDLIDSKDRWYAAVGAVGDGQPEKIPYQLFQEFPELLDIKRTKVYKGKFTEFTELPLYKSISSPVNALIRIGKPIEALRLLWDCKNPSDILKVKEFEIAKAKMWAEINKVLNTKGISYRIGYYIHVWTIESRYNIGGVIASMDSSDNGVTSIVYNKKTGAGNIRGDLSKLIEMKFLEHGITAGGHYGFAGFKYHGDEEILYKIVREVI